MIMFLKSTLSEGYPRLPIQEWFSSVRGLVKFYRTLGEEVVRFPSRTESCMTFCVKAVLQTSFVSFSCASLQVTATYLWIPQVFFGDTKILA
jgi:hypothetical protein